MESVFVSSRFFTDDKRSNVRIHAELQLKLQSYKLFNILIKFYRRLLFA
jgi:hypothetical protein